MTANILVVDDLETNIKVLEAKLLKEYYVVYTANSGYAAIEVLKNQKIDVILLDCMMPELDGFETCKLIKANPETTHIPVVIVTALYDVEDKVKGLEAGADEFLTKPVNDTALFARLKSLSQTKRIIDELKLRSAVDEVLGVPGIKMTCDFTTSKILVIDDDLLQAKHVSSMLSNITSYVKIASNEQMVKDLLTEKFIPNAIILSCQLENHDPLRLLSSLLTNQYVRSSSIIMLAEEENMNIVIKALDLGASDYFIMPVDINELTARIKTQLQRKYYKNYLRTNLEVGMNLSTKDGLSNLYNRGYFDTHIPNLVKNSIANDTSLYALMIDIDNFKTINDLYLHETGDIVIRVVAKVLTDNLRITDIVARYGGEEFIAILSDIQDNIENIANRLREAVIEYFDNFEYKHKLKITVSIGVTKLLAIDNVTSFIARADQALYQAKHAGRNNIKLL